MEASMSKSATDTKISRRGFLKTAGTVTALATMGNTLFGKSVSPILKEAPKEVAPNGGEWVYTWCRQCALPPCGVRVLVEDGVAVKIEGDPQCPGNQGKLCSRGNATIMSVYNPYRVKTPLKRTNPNKGMDEDPGWVEISWDEAYDTIAAELQRVRDDDPRKFIWNNGFARSGSMLEGMEFCEAFGSPNYIEVDGPNCSVHFGSSLMLGNFVGPNFDPAYTNYAIIMGCTSIAGQGFVPALKSFANAVDRGMKVVVVDPRATMESSKGEWVPIRPGSDFAFVLALQNVILYEIQRFDENFIKRRTSGPYLVTPDGYYAKDPETNKPLMWDPEAGEAKVFDDPSFTDYALEGEYEVNGVTCRPAFQIYKEAMAPYTAEWAEEKTTIPAATIRRIAREFVDEAQIGATITLEGTPMPYRPVALHPARGSITQYYGANFHCACIYVNMLVGALDVPGGGQGGLGPPHKSTPSFLALKPGEDGIVLPKVEAKPRAFIFPPNLIDGKTFFPFSHDNPHVVFHAILHPEEHSLGYEPEVLFVWGGNAVLRMYEPEKVLEAMRKMKFIFALSHTIDEPTYMADIVVPESGGLERYSIGNRGGIIDTPEGKRNAVYALVAQQVIEPVYDSKQPDEVFIELADRLGILYGEEGINALLNTQQWAPPRFNDPIYLDVNKKYSPKELANTILKSNAGEDADIDALRNKSSVQILKMLPTKTVYAYTGFPMGQTRYPVYLEYFKKAGEQLKANIEAVGANPPGWDLDKLIQHYQPIPVWIDPVKEIPAEFDLFAVNWKTGQFSFGVGGTAENPWLHEASQFDPLLHKVCMNPKTAKERGLDDGDTVWVESAYGGKIEGTLKLSEAFHPEVVGIAGLFGHQSPDMNPLALKGLHFNSLMSSEPGDIDPVSAGFNGAPNVKVTKA
jgi:anaerobic selenocysteine-containing dehydrogenase